MRFQNILIAIMCIATLQAFQVQTEKGVEASIGGSDCTIYLIKIADDVNKLLPLVENSEWDKILPLAIDLGENLAEAYKCFHQTDAAIFLKNIKSAVTGGCPYIKCVKKQLKRTHKIGFEFIHLLFQGKKDCAKKLIPKIVKGLNKATQCK